MYHFDPDPSFSRDISKLKILIKLAIVSKFNHIIIKYQQFFNDFSFHLGSESVFGFGPSDITKSSGPSVLHVDILDIVGMKITKLAIRFC